MTRYTDVQSVLLLHGGALGDCVLTLHLAAGVRAALPKARVEMVARSPVAAFAAGRGPVDAACHPDVIGLHHLFADTSPPDELRGRLGRFDRVLSFLGGPEAPASRVLGEVLGRRVLFVDPAPRPDAPQTHITGQWRDALSRQGLAARPPGRPLLHVRPAERLAAREELARLAGGHGPLVVFHPGSGGAAKCCPLPVLEEALRLRQEAGDTPLWMMGPAERERSGPDLGRRLAETAPVILEESIPRAAALLGGADAFVGNDAGMTHLAAALALPTVALFGPTSPAVWRPLGGAVAVMSFANDAAGPQFAHRIAARLGADLRHTK